MDGKEAASDGNDTTLVRPHRTLTVRYQRARGGWWEATSPQLTGFAVREVSLEQTRKLAREKLAAWMDPTVELVEETVTVLAPRPLAGPAVAAADDADADGAGDPAGDESGKGGKAGEKRYIYSLRRDRLRIGAPVKFGRGRVISVISAKEPEGWPDEGWVDLLILVEIPVS